MCIKLCYHLKSSRMESDVSENTFPVPLNESYKSLIHLGFISIYVEEEHWTEPQDHYPSYK